MIVQVGRGVIKQFLRCFWGGGVSGVKEGKAKERKVTRYESAGDSE